MIGQLLDGRYQVVEIIESTEFGKTYLARDTRRPGDSLCFVKHLQLNNQDPKLVNIARHRFQQEAKILEKLSQHDRIPQLLAYFEENQEFYLVESYVPGQSLSSEILPGQPLSEQQVIAILTQILEILTFVHAHGVIHRDIKPSNLIRRQSDGKIVLLDFGAVKEIHISQNQNPSTGRIGTMEYMPVEQFECNPHLNSDIYSLGMIAIQALTGLPIYELRKLRSANNHLIASEVVWRHLALVSPELANIIDKMVRYDYRQRYQTAGEVLADLKKISDSSKANLSRLETYREELKRCTNHRGDISVVGRQILDELRLSLELSSEEVEAVEDEILNPYRKYKEKGERYEQALIAAVKQEYPFSKETREELNRLQQVLGITDEDILLIESHILPKSFLTQIQQFFVKFLPSPSPKNPLPPVPISSVQKPKLNQLLLLIPALLGLIAIAGGTVYGYQRWQDIQLMKKRQEQLDAYQLQQIRSLLNAGNYEGCITTSADVSKRSNYYTEIQSLYQQCEAARNWKNTTVKTLVESSLPINSVAFSPDGKVFATGGEDDIIKLFNLETRAEIKTLIGDNSAIWSIDFNSDGSELASGSYFWRLLEWDLQTGKLYLPLEHFSPVWSVEISPDNKTIASASGDTTVKVWDRKTGAILNNFTDHTDTVYAVAFSPDGKTLVSGSNDKTIKIRDLETGRLLHSLDGHLEGVRSLAISSDGQTLVSGSYDNTVKIWNLQTGELLNTLQGHTDDVLSVTISPNGQQIASGSQDKTIKIWDLKTGALLTTLTGHNEAIYSVQFSPNNQRLISGSKDRTVKLWERTVSQK